MLQLLGRACNDLLVQYIPNHPNIAPQDGLALCSLRIAFITVYSLEFVPQRWPGTASRSRKWQRKTDATTNMGIYD